MNEINFRIQEIQFLIHSELPSICMNVYHETKIYIFKYPAYQISESSLLINSRLESFAAETQNEKQNEQQQVFILIGELKLKPLCFVGGKLYDINGYLQVGPLSILSRTGKVSRRPHLLQKNNKNVKFCAQLLSILC